MHLNTKFPKNQVLCVNFQRKALLEIALKIFLKKFFRRALPSTAEQSCGRLPKDVENRTAEPLSRNYVSLTKPKSWRIIYTKDEEVTEKSKIE